MNIVKINDNKLKYIDLLLIGDEQLSMIEKYLYRGEMFALYDNGVKAVCIVTREQSDIYEIKNIAVRPEFQRNGYGQKLISFILNRYKNSNAILYVGTGDSPMTINFYEKCGFVKSHIVKKFFVDNYEHPIFENGKQLIDMIYLKQPL